MTVKCINDLDKFDIAKLYQQQYIITEAQLVVLKAAITMGVLVIENGTVEDAIAISQSLPDMTGTPVAWIGKHDLFRVSTCPPTTGDDEGVAPEQRLTRVILSTDKHSFYGEVPLYTSPLMM